VSRNEGFSFSRWWSVVRKEFLQLRRDRLTFAMIVGIPIVQMTLFGYVINTDPKHLDTAVVDADHSNVTRSFVWAMKNSDYFNFVRELPNEAAGREALARGQILFVVNFPAGFTRQLLRHERPALLVEADGTDPTAAGSALSALNGITASVIQKELTGPLLSLANGPAPFEVRIHRLYNPEGLTQYNVVPGLMGVILTMTMVMMTGLAITRERERGTMENLLAMPSTPLEVMTGKLIPYIGIGLIQATIILLAACYMFHVPFFGSVGAIYLVALLFVAANLTVGITLFPGPEPTAGGAAYVLLLFAQYSAFRLYVSLSRDAKVGAVAWRSPPAHLFQPAGPRHHAQGQRLVRLLAQCLALVRFHNYRHDRRGQNLPPDFGLR
jgi:ABC-2 type transport system permease protein